jgi:hypothetical protein
VQLNDIGLAPISIKMGANFLFGGKVVDQGVVRIVQNHQISMDFQFHKISEFAKTSQIAKPPI